MIKGKQEKLNGSSSVELRSLWRPEYASYMVNIINLISINTNTIVVQLKVEGTPGGPYGGSTNYFNTVEHNMRVRR